MSTVMKNGIERIEGGGTLRVRNRIQAKEGKNKIPNSNKKGHEEYKME